MPDLHLLRLYGASDDLLEVEGYIRDEFNAWGRGATVILTAPNGARIGVDAEFCPVGAMAGIGEGWVLSVLHADPEWVWPVRLSVRPDRSTDPAIELDVPEGTTLRLWGDDDA